jgi:hypothetical protein
MKTRLIGLSMALALCISASGSAQQATPQPQPQQTIDISSLVFLILFTSGTDPIDINAYIIDFGDAEDAASDAIDAIPQDQGN